MASTRNASLEYSAGDPFTSRRSQSSNETLAEISRRGMYDCRAWVEEHCPELGPLAVGSVMILRDSGVEPTPALVRERLAAQGRLP